MIDYSNLFNLAAPQQFGGLFGNIQRQPSPFGQPPDMMQQMQQIMNKVGQGVSGFGGQSKSPQTPSAGGQSQPSSSGGILGSFGQSQPSGGQQPQGGILTQIMNNPEMIAKLMAAF